MSTKLFVGNLPFSLNETSLRELFAKFGNVDSVKIVTDAFDGRSKGFGFVEMSTDDEANASVTGLNGSQVEGRSIKVDLARPKDDSMRPARDARPHSGESRSNSNFRFGNNDNSGERRNRY
ncbi:MAG: hypothetical protein P4L22_06795 [Candidatus Babeliales bacterium]|nr:hypothetical protein [Candidatus Babeliales bacterium]